MICPGCSKEMKKVGRCYYCLHKYCKVVYVLTHESPVYPSDKSTEKNLE